MISLVTALAPLVCGLLLAVTGAGKLFGRQVAQLAANTVLVRIFNDGRRATLALRLVGAAEIAIAVGLLAVPGSVVSGAAATALGVGFTGYLGYAKVTAPESSCGCSARSEGPIGWRAFTRAGLVVAFGLLTLAASAPWWSQLTEHPVASVVLVLVAAAVLLVLSDAEDNWLLPVRRLRLKLFGHPLGGDGEQVPLAASVELLERSFAWQAASGIVRSSLIDHWDEDGWRILRFTGVHEGEPGGGSGDEKAAGSAARPVNVLFALDITATLDNAPRPAVRVTVIDDRTDEVVPVSLHTGMAERTLLPLVDQAEPALTAQPTAS